MFSVNNRVKLGISYLALYAIIVVSLLIIEPINAAVNAGAFPFTAWFFDFINTFSSISFWIFTFAALLSVGYIRGKGNEKFDVVFIIIATYTLIWMLIVAINDIFATALASGAIGKLRGSAVGARNYDWSGFFSGFFMLVVIAYFVINTKFWVTIISFFKEVLAFSGHGEKIVVKKEDFTPDMEMFKSKKPKAAPVNNEETKAEAAPVKAEASEEVKTEATLEEKQEEKAAEPVKEAPKKKAKAPKAEPVTEKVASEEGFEPVGEAPKEVAQEVTEITPENPDSEAK